MKEGTKWITDEMMELQEGRKYLWSLSPEEKKRQAMAKDYNFWKTMIEWYGKDSKEAKEAHNLLSKEAIENGYKSFRIVKPPRKVFVYTFTLHLRDGNLKPEVLKLIEKQTRC